MICKYIGRRNKTIILSIGFLLLILTGIHYMKQQKYQMYVFHFVEYGEPEWPNKKVWFNAKQWLSDEENYLKINDHDFIYKKSMQIPNTDLFIYSLYCTVLYEKGITEQNLPYEQFVREVKPTIHGGQYLYSEFDQDTLQPTVHSFLVKFRLNGKFYETNLVWKMDKRSAATYGVYKPGEYFKEYDGYTYQDYLKGKLPSESK